MANQPPRGGAESRRSAAPTNPGRGSSAPPGLRSSTTQQSSTGRGPTPSPSPAPSIRLQPSSQDGDNGDHSPSPEPPSGTKRSRHGSPVSSRAPTPTPQTPSRDASMGPLSGDDPLTGDWSSYVDSDDPFSLQKPRTPRELTGEEPNLEVELETARELVQHIRSWVTKTWNVPISDTFVDPNNVQEFVLDLKSLFETSNGSSFLQQGIAAAESIPPSRQGSVAPSDAEMSTPTGPTTPPRSGQSADADVSMTPKASERKPADPPQPQGSGSGPSGSGPKSGGPSRADKGKQPVRTNPVAVQPRPQSKKPVVPFQRMGMPPPINRATKPKKSYASAAKSVPNIPVTVAQLAKVAPNLPVN